MNTQPRNDFHHSIITHDQYQFEPIDQEISSLTKSSNHFIQRPIPIHHSQSNVMNERSSYVLPAKRNSTLNIQSTTTMNDSNNRTFPLSRSITTDQLASNHHRTTRLYYYPSVQDVLDALERRAFDKESMV